MNRIWDSRDRWYSSTGQYMKIEHWELPQMFEFTVYKANTASEMPSEKVSSFQMLREDVEYLIQALQDYLQDYDTRGDTE